MAISYESKNQFRARAKIGEAEFVQLVYGFASGISIKAISKSIGTSAKSVRAEYLHLRGLLKRPEFNRWHGSKRALLIVSDAETEALIKTAFIDVLAECHFNTTCHRNYRLGNRKAPRCRACPITEKMSSEAHADELVEIIHMIAAFYTRIGIRGELDKDRLTTFRERFIHAVTVETARDQSTKLNNGLPDPSDFGELAVGSLVDRLLSAYIDDDIQRLERHKR